MNKSKCRGEFGKEYNKRNTEIRPKQQDAITLVALIITIIVLLILAMVSIRLIMNGGIIDRAEKGVTSYSESEVQEQIKLAFNEWQTAVWDGTAVDTVAFMQTKLREVLNNQTVAVSETNGTFIVTMIVNGKEKQFKFNSTTGQTKKVENLPNVTASTNNSAVSENCKYTVDEKTAIIPEGFAISNVVSEQSINNGLVINKAGNEWVWIPVSSSDLSAMYTEDTTGWTMSGTDVVTKYKSNSEIISGVSRVNPGNTSSYREPDVLNNNDYDKSVTNLSNASLGTNIGEAAGKLKDDYKAMLDSIRKYGGFYIGRYELSNAGTQKNQASLTNTNWYNLYKKCRDIESTSNVVVSTMIFGCQWDHVCKFISTYGDKVSLTNSCSYGNCNNSSGNAYVTGKGTKQVTGFCDYWKANNIYDLAGNCEECTQEALETKYRTIRGGRYGLNGDIYPVTFRDRFDSISNSANGVTSRPILYIK